MTGSYSIHDRRDNYTQKILGIKKHWEVFYAGFVLVNWNQSAWLTVWGSTLLTTDSQTAKFCTRSASQPTPRYTPSASQLSVSDWLHWFVPDQTDIAVSWGRSSNQLCFVHTQPAVFDLYPVSHAAQIKKYCRLANKRPTSGIFYISTLLLIWYYHLHLVVTYTISLIWCIITVYFRTHTGTYSIHCVF
jgi:hypothetical protein